MDLEKESALIKVDTGKSQELSELCTRLLELQKQITRCEENIKNLRSEERLLSENEIPNLMQQAGISSLKLIDGSSVSFKPEYYAKIPISKIDEAFNWLSSNGHGDLIKNEVSLKAFVKDEIQKGNNLPMDLFGVYVSNKTTIKTKE